MSLSELLMNPQFQNLLGQHDMSPPPPLKARQVDDDHRRNDDQSRVIMKFEEKRQLLQAICDRKDQLFGPVAAKMKPNQKQALWEEVIDTFRQACPDSTAELSSGYVRGIFWQNLRKRTLAKKERSATDENVKFDELDELVAQILGDKMNNTPPASVTSGQHSSNDPPSQVSNLNISDILLPVLQDTFYQYQQTQDPDSRLSPAPTLNNATLDYSKFTPQTNLKNGFNFSSKKRSSDDCQPGSSIDMPPQLKRKKVSVNEEEYTALAVARLANIEAETAKIQAETRLLELRYALECKRNNISPERLGDGRMAFIISDNEESKEEIPPTNTAESVSDEHSPVNLDEFEDQ